MTSGTAITAIQIKADGHVLSRPLSSNDTGRSLCNAIGCDLFDVVSLDEGIDLFVDDEGINRGAPLNLVATVLAHVLGSRAVLFGTAVAVSTDAAGETIGLSPAQTSRITDALQHRPAPATIDALADSLAPFPAIAQMFRA